MTGKHKKYRQKNKKDSVIIPKLPIDTPRHTEGKTRNEANAAKISPDPVNGRKPIYLNVHFREWVGIFINFLLAIFTWLLFEIATDQADIASSSNDSAIKSAISSEKSASIAEESMRVSNRAYVYIQDFTARLTKDSIVIGEYSVKNFGNSPAKDTRVTIGSSVLPSFSDTLRFYADSVSIREFSIPPGKIIKYTPYKSSKISTLWMKKLNIGEAHLYVYGVIEYKDMFDNKWSSTFCGEIVLSNNGKQSFVICPGFNKMR